MSILAFVFALAFAVVLLFVVVAAARRGGVKRGGDGMTWYSDGGAGFSDSGTGADCGSGTDGGGSCDGGGGSH